MAKLFRGVARSDRVRAGLEAAGVRVAWERDVTEVDGLYELNLAEELSPAQDDALAALCVQEGIAMQVSTPDGGWYIDWRRVAY
jgi:hypothetical protein